MDFLTNLSLSQVDTSFTFDMASVMLYRNDAFSKNGKDTLKVYEFSYYFPQKESAWAPSISSLRKF